jgi:hypothetical protein
MKKTCLTIIVLIAVFVIHATMASAEMGSVQGVILKAPKQEPIPGLTVSLVHPILGRSAPSFTNNFGQFIISSVPPRQEPYYLEIYWGQRLVYRTAVQIKGGPLRLTPIILR